MGGQSSSQGPVIGIIVVIIVLLVGAFYFMGRIAPAPSTETPSDATTSEEVAPVSSSSEVSDIEADLNAEDFSDIDAELETL